MPEDDNLQKAVTLGILEWRMTALENSVKADVADLRRDVQDEAKYTREALSKRDAAQITTLIMTVLALVGICAEILLRTLPALGK